MSRAAEALSLVGAGIPSPPPPPCNPLRWPKTCFSRARVMPSAPGLSLLVPLLQPVTVHSRAASMTGPIRRFRCQFCTVSIIDCSSVRKLLNLAATASTLASVT